MNGSLQVSRVISRVGSDGPQTNLFDDLRNCTDMASVASVLQVDQSLLRDLTNCESNQLYDAFSIRKRTGGLRTIRAPNDALKSVQKHLAHGLSTLYHPRSCVHGYTASKSHITGASMHVRQHLCLKLDLKDFFPSIHYGRVRGVLQAPPFELNPYAAAVVAKLCVYWNGSGQSELPQGAPTSPILSNIICKGLDNDLILFAKKHRLVYTRYADDLTFSTDRRVLPASVAIIPTVQGQRTEIGEDLRKIIARAGFEINDRKVRLVRSTDRQRVTGLVVNEKLNLPREFIRNTRAILNNWSRHGEEITEARFRQLYDVRNRRREHLPSLRKVVRGRVQYIGSIKGWSDPVYLKLARQLAYLDKDFIFDKRRARAAASKIVLVVEGTTDQKHIESALGAFKRLGQYKDLFLEVFDANGGPNVSQMCKNYAKREQQYLTVFLVDRDQDGILKELTDRSGGYKEWGNNVFSLALPIPPHRGDGENLCIEMYFTDEDLTRRDVNGRRLFLLSEFDEERRHKTARYYTLLSKKHKSPVIDEAVYQIDNPGSIALSKNAFAEAVRDGVDGFTDVDFSHFAVLFDELVSIQSQYLADSDGALERRVDGTE